MDIMGGKQGTFNVSQNKQGSSKGEECAVLNQHQQWHHSAYHLKGKNEAVEVNKIQSS